MSEVIYDKQLNNDNTKENLKIDIENNKLRFNHSLRSYSFTFRIDKATALEMAHAIIDKLGEK